MAVPFSEHSFNASLEAVELVIRDEREGRAGEAAAVDADSTFAAEKLLAERDGERHILLLDVPRRDHVLKQRSVAVAVTNLRLQNNTSELT